MKRVVKRLASFLLVVSMLAGLVVNAAVADTDVAKIGDTGYATFDAALTAAADGDTVTLLKDTTLASTVTTAAGAVTVDMAGKTLTYTSAGALVVGGALTFTGGGQIDIKEGWGASYAIDIRTNVKTIRFDGVDVNVEGTGSKIWAMGTDATKDLMIFDNGAKLTSTYGYGGGYFIRNLGLHFENGSELEYWPVSGTSRFMRQAQLWLDDSTATIKNSIYCFYQSGFYVRNGSTFNASEVSSFTSTASATLSVFYVDSTSTFELKDKGTPTFVTTPKVADGATFNTYTKSGDGYVTSTVSTSAVAVETLKADGTIAGFYTTVDAAKAATTGIYKVVDTDVLEGVTVDLAGETWIIDEYTAVSASQKIIDTVGGGVLKCEKLNLYGSNGYYMPLFNETKGGYNLFAFGVAMVDGDVDKVGNTTRFWYNLSFPDAAAYDLIATGKSKVNFGADVVCGNANLDVTFSDSTSANSFAAGWAVAAKGNNALYMYTGITNLDAQSGKTLNLMPTMEISGQTVEIPLGTIEYVVQ